ncbi:MAG: endonuclease/exonuclease/phosphatase family protein [Kiritimatiellia bacterium]|nr:endonuclease/exonuclease/phosphatase family protein [Kiritimatiellia bacterium]
MHIQRLLSMGSLSRKILRFLVRALCWVLLLSITASARSLRVATWNVEHGIGAPESEKGAAQRAILQRVDADIIAFQELNAGTSNGWVRLASDLGYPHRVWGELGPYAGNMVVGFYSRFPILSVESVRSPEGAQEFSRLPLRVTVQIPGAAQPLTLWTMHHKAMFRPVDEFRRAVEAFRIARDIENFATQNPAWSEWILLGDMNDDPARGGTPPESPQTPVFREIPDRLPKTYQIGSDLSLPLTYRAFPLDTYQTPKTRLKAVDAFREGTESLITHFHTNLRLDYIFLSEGIWKNTSGQPVAEIYHTDWETGKGLRKSGNPLPRQMTAAASDHYVVFVDFHIEDGKPEP